jgi:hypothetical protein
MTRGFGSGTGITGSDIFLDKCAEAWPPIVTGYQFEGLSNSKVASKLGVMMRA